MRIDMDKRESDRIFDRLDEVYIKLNEIMERIRTLEAAFYNQDYKSNSLFESDDYV